MILNRTVCDFERHTVSCPHLPGIRVFFSFFLKKICRRKAHVKPDFSRHPCVGLLVQTCFNSEMKEAIFTGFSEQL